MSESDEIDVDDGGEEIDVGGAECRTVADFYKDTGRRTIGLLCRRFLNENALTPTELLHAPRHQQALSNLPTFFGILQQAERVRTDKGTLNKLVNDVARWARERIKESEPPTISPETWGEEVGKLCNRDDPDLDRFRVLATVAAHILPHRTYGEKAAALTALALTARGDDEIEFVEQFLAEMLHTDSCLPSITADPPFKTLVGFVVTLLAADRPLEAGAPETLRHWETLLKTWPMPRLTEGLVSAFCRLLRRPEHFTIAAAGDLGSMEATERELMALAELAGRLRVQEEFVGGREVEDALQRRGALLINEDSLHELLRGRNLIEKLRTLFGMQKLPLPLTSERAINGYIDQYMQSRDFAGRLLDCWKEQGDKIRGVVEVQRLVQESFYTEREREGMAAALDEVQYAYLRTQRILAPLTGRDDAPPDLVIDLARLAGDDAFCTGKSRATVARALFRQVHRPRFIRAYLLSGDGAKARLARTNWLRAALKQVGVPFIDLGLLRVLVVDDEDGPRNFIESVLRDLGVTEISPASDGREALDRFAAERGAFDLVICDWMMPRLSGLEVLRVVRQMRPDLPFLMVTALATPKAVHMALEHKVTGYIAKPFTPDQLEEKVLLALTQKVQLTVAGPGG